jgi:hypothetical protein
MRGKPRRSEAKNSGLEKEWLPERERQFIRKESA